MSSTKSVEPKIYVGGCHCGRFRFKFPHVPFEEGQHEVTDCNCSICSMVGVLWIYSKVSSVEFTAGSLEELTTYLFYKKENSHHFCPTCGVELLEIHNAGQDAGINVRALDGIDPSKLKLEFYDGKSL